MRVRKNNKELYHIQNMNMGSDGHAFDLFVWCDHEPNSADLRKAYLLEFEGTEDEYNTELLNEFLESSEVYSVWAEEI